MSITPENLMTLEAYAKYRKSNKPEIIAHRRLRSVALGEHLNFQFESELTIRYQIQEMLRVEKIFEEEAIQAEIDTYLPLVPEGDNWKATMLIEYGDVAERRKALAQMIGIEDAIYIEVAGEPRVYAIADEDMDRENDEKTSAVHFVRFQFPPATIAAIKAATRVTLGCDHPYYTQSASIPAEKLAALVLDFK